MKLLIDADLILYRGGFAAEKTKYTLTSPGVKTQEFMSKRALMEVVQGLELTDYYISKERIVEPVENALSNTRNIIHEIFATVPKFNADRDTFQLYLSGSTNFRKKIDPEYKAQRDKTFKPHWTNEIQNYLMRYWDAQLTDGHEADDALSIAWSSKGWNEAMYLVSSDKDFNQLPYLTKFNFVSHEITRTLDYNAICHFLGQMAQGDSADNVKGIYGLGPKKWERCVAAAEGQSFKLWDSVVDLYKLEFKDNWKQKLIKNYYLLRLPRSYDEIPNEQDIQRIIQGTNADERIENIKISATSGGITEEGRDGLREVPRNEPGLHHVQWAGNNAFFQENAIMQQALNEQRIHAFNARVAADVEEELRNAAHPVVMAEAPV